MVIVKEQFPELSSKCPECGNATNSDKERADCYCPNCGLILSEREIDFTGMERNFYTQSEKGKRLTRGDFHDDLRRDLNKSTMIHRKEIQQLPYNHDLRRAVRIDKHTPNNVCSRRENQVRTLIEKAGAILDLPNPIIRSCLYLMKKIFKKTDCKGRNYADLVGLIILYECKKQRYPILFQQIKETCGTSKGRVLSWFKLIQLIIPDFRFSVRHPTEYIPKFCSNLKLSQDIENSAIKILNSLSGQVLSGKKPSIIAAAVLHLLTKGLITQKQLSEVASCSEVSIRNHSRKLKSLFKI